MEGRLGYCSSSQPWLHNKITWRTFKYPDILRLINQHLESGTQASALFTQTGKGGFFTSSQGMVTEDRALGKQRVRGSKGELWWHTQYCNSSDLFLRCVFYNLCWTSGVLNTLAGNRSSSQCHSFYTSNKNNKGAQQFTRDTQQKTTRICWGTEPHVA